MIARMTFAAAIVPPGVAAVAPTAPAAPLAAPVPVAPDWVPGLLLVLLWLLVAAAAAGPFVRYWRAAGKHRGPDAQLFSDDGPPARP
jgi:hypothetical protein